jgi:hypothetical protein
LGEGSQRVAEVQHGCVELKQDSSAAVPLIAWTRRLLAAAGETEGDGRGIFLVVVVVVAAARLLVASSRARGMRVPAAASVGKLAGILVLLTSLQVSLRSRRVFGTIRLPAASSRRLRI